MNDFDYMYDVVKLNHPIYKYLVLANSSDCITDVVTMDDFPGVYNGTVVFDLLLFEGLDDNRFVTMKIRNGEIDESSAQYFEHVEPEIEFECAKYYALHSNLITYSSLTDDEKDEIFHEIKEYFCTAYT